MRNANISRLCGFLVVMAGGILLHAGQLVGAVLLVAGAMVLLLVPEGPKRRRGPWRDSAGDGADDGWESSDNDGGGSDGGDGGGGGD